MLNVVFDRITLDLLLTCKLEIPNSLIDDVACLGRILDIGPISDECFSNERMKYLGILNPSDASLKKIWEDYDTIKDALCRGERIRVWHCHMAFSFCGLALLCHMAKDSDSEIFLLECPKEVAYPKESYKPLFPYIHWGMISPAKCCSSISEEKILSVQERERWDFLWCKLQQENTNLRILKNGNVTSVEDSYYDDIIMEILHENAADDNERYVSALEKAGEYIHDTWFFYRMNSLKKNKQLL